MCGVWMCVLPAGRTSARESGQEASAVAASFGKCDISIADAFLDALGDDVPAEARGCIEDKLDEDTLSELFASSIVEGSDAGDLPPDLLTALTECFTG